MVAVVEVPKRHPFHQVQLVVPVEVAETRPAVHLVAGLLAPIQILAATVRIKIARSQAVVAVVRRLRGLMRLVAAATVAQARVSARSTQT